jgi:hypothetical protein
MQTWQLVPLVILPIVIAIVVVMRKRFGQQAQAMYAAETARLHMDWARQQRPGETEPAFVVAMTRSTFKAAMFMIAVTNRRLLLAPVTGPLRSFEPGTYSLSLRPRQWVDGGNTTTTYSSGLEAAFQSGGETHTWRIYDAIEGYDAQAACVHTLRVALHA